MLLRLLYIWIYNPRYLLNKDDSGCLSLEWRNTYPACSARHRRPCRPKWLHTEKKREFSQRFFRLCSSVYEVHTCTMCWESTLEHINMFEAVEKKGLPKIVISYFWVAYASYPGPTTSAVNSSSTHLCHQLNCYWYRLVLTQVVSDKFTRSAVHNTLWGTDKLMSWVMTIPFFGKRPLLSTCTSFVNKQGGGQQLCCFMINFFHENKTQSNNQNIPWLSKASDMGK